MSKKYSSQTFSEKDAQKEILKKTGERIYTKREWTDSEPVYITYNYYVIGEKKKINLLLL